MLSACVSLLIRSALILAGAEAARRLGRRTTATYRHQVMLVGFVLLLSWPFFSAFVPEIPVPLWPLKPVTGRVTVQQTTVSIRYQAPAAWNVNWPVTIWLLGVMLALSPAVVGYLRVRRIALKAKPLDDRSALNLLDTECGRLKIPKPYVRIHPQPVMPFAFGLWRTQIVLPAEWLEWSEVRRQSVLLHELAHVKRRDILWQFLATIATALWWFQPLTWRARRILRRESELACDAFVLESGVRPSEYATELLAIARQFTDRQRWSPAAIAMAQPGELEGRLHALLEMQASGGRKWRLAAAATFCAVGVSASAVTIFPSQREIPGGYMMKRTVLSGLLASAGLSAATIGGSVFDPNGAAVANAQASLYNTSNSVQQETTTSPDGKFNFEALGAGSYILRIQKPGFAALYREFNVQQDSDVQRGLMLKAATARQPSSGAVTTPEPQNSKVLRVRGTMAEDNLIQKVQPVYPVAAKEARVQGTVELDVTISKEGVPVDIRVVSSPSDDLTKSALDAVGQWRYRPTLLNGEPAEIVTDVIVNYTLSQ